MSASPLRWTVAGAVCAVLLAACSPDSEIRSEDGTINSLVFTPPDDAAMARAMEAGRASLDLFFALYAQPEPGDEDFSVKIGLPVEGGGSEHIWVGVDKVEGDQVTGTLQNVPVGLPDLHKGSTLSFAKSEIEDWSFVRGGLFHGQFTTRAMANHMTSPKEQAEAKELLAGLWPNAIPERH